MGVGLWATGCSRDNVVLYCSVDEEFARTVVTEYEKRTGRQIDVVFDSEAGKTTGLVRRIRAEGDHPRADLFWSSELINTVLLARDGLLASYTPPTLDQIPSHYRDAQGRWTAVAVRARVLAYDPERVTADALPSTWEELAEPRWASQVAMANPLFGTTRGHVAAMFALWGPQRGRAFLTGLRDHGAMVVDGNSTAARKVMGGQVAMCMTDTDDVYAARRRGFNLELRYLDMGDGGTFTTPCSVAVIQGARHPAKARQLYDYLISAEVEEQLFRSTSGNVPVRQALRSRLGAEYPPTTAVSYDAVADAMDEAVTAVREILIR